MKIKMFVKYLYKVKLEKYKLYAINIFSTQWYMPVFCPW